MTTSTAHAGAHRASRQHARLSSHWLVVGGLGAAVLCAVLHLALLWRFPPYYDEGFYGQAAWYALGHPEARFIALRDNKGPLLTWLAFIPLRFDRDAILSSVRLVAATAGLVTLPVVGALVRRFADRAIAVTAMVVFALLPFVLVQTSMGIHEPLVMAAGTLALYLQVRLAEEPRLDTGLLLGFALAAGLLTKASGLYALLLLPLSLLLFDWRSPGRWPRFASWAGSVAAALVIVLMGQALVRMSPDFYAADAARSAAHQFNSPGYALRHLGPIIGENWPAYRVQLLGYVTLPLVLVGGVGVAAAFARRHQAAIVLLGWLLLPIAVSVLIANKPLARYFLPAMPAAVILIAIGLVTIARALRRRFARRARVAALAAFLVLALGPAIVFDARFVLSPSTTELPGFDDRELLADASAGTGWPELGRELAIRTHGALTIVVISGIPNEILQSLAADGGKLAPIVNVTPGDPRAAQGRYFIENGGAPPGREFRVLWSFQRPRDGVPLRLYGRVK